MNANLGPILFNLYGSILVDEFSIVRAERIYNIERIIEIISILFKSNC